MRIRTRFRLRLAWLCRSRPLRSCSSCAARSGPRLYTTWSQPGGSIEGAQYSALKQINKTNVRQLELQWFHPAPGPTGRFAFSPLVVDNVMYVVGKDSAVFALDAATGKEMWTLRDRRHADQSRIQLLGEQGSIRSPHHLRVAQLSPAARRANGQADCELRRQRPRESARGARPHARCRLAARSRDRPGTCSSNLLVLGSAPGEGYNSPPGDIRAFDVLTGRLVWTFHTIPRPGEFGYDTWPPDAWKTAGGANTWAEFAIDEKRGIGYFPLGSPTFDLWGGDRKGNNLFGNTLLALDLRTGKRLWHYQLLHHDLWDYDLVTGPKLLTVTHNGKPIDIVAQATKFGLLYVFNRVDGPAALADRGAAGAAERRARRAVVADAAVSDQAGAVFAAEVHRSRREPVP